MILRPLLLSFMLVLAPGLTQAGPYPEKPIKLIVPFAPGGGGDVQGRLVAAKLSERLKQSVVVENRGGAGGNIGTSMVAKAPADGYTLLLATAATVINPTVWAKAGFQAKELTGAAAWSVSPLLILTNPKLPVNSLPELIDYAKARPGDLTFGSGGIGIITHVEMELLKQHAGIDLMHIAFPGQAPAVTAAVGGHVDLLADSVASGMPLVKAGRLRALAVTSEKRLADDPSIPTVAEQGYGPLAHSAWYGVMAPAGTPSEVLRVLSDAIGSAQQAPDTVASLAAVGAEPFQLDTEAFNRFLAEQGEVWSALTQSAGIRVE